MPWAAAGAVAGALITSSATGKAAEGQQQASAQANALQQYMYDNNVALNAPNINTGNAARDRLSYLLGLSPTGFSGGAGGGSSAPTLTYDQLRSQLQGQYTKTGSSTGGPVQYANGQAAVDALGPLGAYNYFLQNSDSGPQTLQGNPAANGAPGYWGTKYGSEGAEWIPMTAAAGQNNSYIDESGLDAEIKRRLADQDAQRQAAITAAQNDPNYGRLAQQFQFDQYTPAEKYEAGKFSYTGEDLYNDPSYLFRLQQGQKALDRQGAAAGRFLSGSQLQASSNYNQGAASQEFQNAYQRALGTFGTNETGRYNAFQTNETNRKNAFDTNQQNAFNAYQSNFSNSVNPLLALSGSGQVSAQFLGGAGQQTAQLMGNNLTGQANASGAAGLAGANSISNGISNAYNGYQQQQQRTDQNNVLQQLLSRSGSVNNNPSSGFSFDSMGASSGNSLLGATSNPWA